MIEDYELYDLLEDDGEGFYDMYSSLSRTVYYLLHHVEHIVGGELTVADIDDTVTMIKVMDRTLDLADKFIELRKKAIIDLDKIARNECLPK